MAQKILIIEDMEDIVFVLKEYLEREGFQVTAAYNGLQGLQAVTEQKPDLVILDLTLPGLEGLEVCRRIRRDPETAQIPVLILSGKGEEVDKVVGLEVGADDYMTKPFGPKELVARVKTLLRRTGAPQVAKVLKAGQIEMDLERYTVNVRGRGIALTLREFDLLRALLEVKGRALSREFLLEKVWGRDREVGIETRTIDVHIRSLRNKLGPEGRRILTVRNVGYRLDFSPEGPNQDSPSREDSA